MGTTGWDPSTCGDIPKDAQQEGRNGTSIQPALPCSCVARPACPHRTAVCMLLGDCSCHPQKGRGASHHTGTPRKKQPHRRVPAGPRWAGRTQCPVLPERRDPAQCRTLRCSSTPPSPPLSIHRGPGSSLLSEPLRLVPLLRKPTFPFLPSHAPTSRLDYRLLQKTHI